MSFDILPIEIMGQIFNYIPINIRGLSIGSRSNLRLVCHNWKCYLDCKCMWIDIKTYNIHYLDKNSYNWLKTSTKFFDDHSNIINICTFRHIRGHYIVKILKDINFNINHDFACAILKHCLKFSELSELKKVDAMIRRRNIDSIIQCKYYVEKRMLCTGKKISIYDDCNAWIIRNYVDFDDDSYINSRGCRIRHNIRPENLFFKLIGIRYTISAKEVLKRCKKGFLYFRAAEYILKNFDERYGRVYEMVHLLKLNSAETEDAFRTIILIKNKNRLKGLLQITEILTFDPLLYEDERHMMRSAKIIHYLIEYTSDYVFLKWITDNFYYILSKIGRNNKEVEEYIHKSVSSLYEYPVYTKDPEKTNVEELIDRVPTYIKTGNIRQLKFVIKTIRNEKKSEFKSIVEYKFRYWTKLSKQYPEPIYEVLISLLKC
jgi:hypothetical protein